MVERDGVTWTAMIQGYALNGHLDQALKLFQEMDLEGVVPDEATYSITFTSILTACSHAGEVPKGYLTLAKEIHASVLASQFWQNRYLANLLVEMYGKCGNLESASSVFATIDRDVVSWNSVVQGFAQHGQGRVALELFHEMILNAVAPQTRTCLSVLLACGHLGLLERSREYFLSMQGDHGLAPAVEHYRSMVDGLGRSGKVAEAESLIQTMPFLPDSVAWLTLLSACRTHSSGERGAIAAEKAFESDKRAASQYVLLSSLLNTRPAAKG
ncbi:hypothetical protein SELMODRAFT_109426 [Selaginella moellendorffii]|uniref:Pentacotripeptide-repeat region of PRORP domain-containing protein n=1 Tax=Selaginella moellendorffii TaxID=88036 RepID=D8S5R0_SELML|nr:hypothetical protein SELMODRAFT_109426 [Selaginella moellendorffii]